MSERASSFVIENREHLLSLLTEAAEIEHNLMCCYLYAAFSLKDALDEDLSEAELAAVQRWRRAIVGVAIDEMAHLALVSNLSVAVGGVPHFHRANFPVAAGYHPAGIVVKLAPFDRATLDHFIYLERPECVQIDDGAGFDPPKRYRRFAIPGRLMPTAQDYDTVGELYRAIHDGLDRLGAQLGEAALFTGDPAHQIGPDAIGLPGLTRVKCLKTASAAIDGIVIQGEGAPGHVEASHYARFLAIRDELDRLQAVRSGFVPARSAAHNPVMRHPPTPEDKVWVELQPAASLLDVVNATYAHMLRLLAQAYAETRGVAAQRAMLEAAIDLMFAISPAASALTRLPASEQHPGTTAGMSFATMRACTALPAGARADRVLVERLAEIGATAHQLAGDVPVLARAADALDRITARMAAALASVESAAPAPAAAATAESARATSPAPAGGPPPSTITDGVESVEGTALTLRFDSRRCIHARHCVLGQPAVFKANVQGPWLDPDAASVEALVTVAHMCPSGAITYLRKDGGAAEPVPPVNLIQLRENGPLGVRGELYVDGAPVGYRATLCRCGASRRKPFCDGSHATVGFTATGEPLTRASEPLALRNGPLHIRPQHNGPLVVSGNLELCAGTGRTVDRLTEVRLCRCGGSANKPYCDGTHARIGFQSE